MIPKNEKQHKTETDGGVLIQKLVVVSVPIPALLYKYLYSYKVPQPEPIPESILLHQYNNSVCHSF